SDGKGTQTTGLTPQVHKHSRPMRWLKVSVGYGCALFIALQSFAADPEQEKLNTAVEALTRLENVNLDEKPAVKAALDRVLSRTRGTPNFVRLVRHFKLTNQ